MLAIKIDAATEKRLAQAAERLGQAPDAVAMRALETYLEDIDDHLLAEEAMRDYDPAENVPLAELKTL